MCEQAHRSAQNICAACIAQFPDADCLCPICAEKITGPAAECRHCQIQTPAFSRTHLAWQWGWPLDQAIKRFKFDQDLALGRDLAAVFAAQLLQQQTTTAADYFVAMPMHRTRLRQRGFNQAAILAAALAGAYQRPLLTAAKRIRATPAQSGLNRQQRLKNLKGAFTVEADLRGKRIAIVDDVMTTGSSAQVLTEALLVAGASSVEVYVLCKVA